LLTKTVTSSRWHILVPGGIEGPSNGHGSCGRRAGILAIWVGVLVFVLAACSGSNPGVVEDASPSSSAPPAASEDPPPGSSNSTQAPDVSVAPSPNRTTSSTFAIVEPTSIPPTSTSTSTTTTVSPWLGIVPFGADNMFTDFREGSDTIFGILRALGYDSFEGEHPSATSESFRAASVIGVPEIGVSIRWGVDEPLSPGANPDLAQLGGRTVGVSSTTAGNSGMWLVCRGLYVSMFPDGGFEQNTELLDTIIDQLGC
jgi:hypothetical protein